MQASLNDVERRAELERNRLTAVKKLENKDCNVFLIDDPSMNGACGFSVSSWIDPSLGDTNNARRVLVHERAEEIAATKGQDEAGTYLLKASGASTYMEEGELKQLSKRLRRPIRVGARTTTTRKIHITFISFTAATSVCHCELQRRERNIRVRLHDRKRLHERW
jgi:hypothetical protein